MMNVCWECGSYHADKIIDPGGPFAICPDCGYRHPFRQLPLLLVSGASGTGKSSACQSLLGEMDEVVLLDSDILWRPDFDTPLNSYQDFFETWLRMCKNIGQSGRAVVLFGAGFGVPSNLESCVERRYFSNLHYLALTCDDETLLERLQQRPAWRGTHSPEFQAEHVRFNRWFKEHDLTPATIIELIDTSNLSMDDTAERVAAWIRDRI